VATLLLDRNANPDRKDRYGDTPLLKAIQNGELRIVQALLDAGAGIDTTDGNGNTPLMLAIRSGHTAIARYLVKARAELNGKNRKGWTALDLARNSGDKELEQLLLMHGAVTARKEPVARINIADRVRQRTPGDDSVDAVSPGPILVEAAWRGQEDVVNALLEDGVPDVMVRWSG